MNLPCKGPTLVAIALATLLAMTGCGTRHISKDISSDGVPAQVIFPEEAALVLNEGTFPNLENLRLVDAGMTKDQLYQLLGQPHYREGLMGVREWDYLFHFRQGSVITTCNYKVIFDSQKLTRSFYWAPASCADLLKEKAPDTAHDRPAERTFSLSADALFSFGAFAMQDMQPAGRQELDKIASELSGAKLDLISIVGHTDRIGRQDDNELLSYKRARTVYEYLIEKGLERKRMSVEGKGESMPVTDCVSTDRQALIDCLAPNRRVEVIASAARSS